MSTAGSTTTGAIQGGTAGAAFGPIGIGVGAVLGALSGYFGARSARSAERQRLRAEEHIKNILSVKKYNKLYGKYLPILRSQVYASVAPELQQKVAGDIAERGLAGTGLGEVLRGLSTEAPAIEASRLAGEKARETQVDRARAEGAHLARIEPQPSPILDILRGGTTGAMFGAQLANALRKPVAGQPSGASDPSNTGFFPSTPTEVTPGGLMPGQTQAPYSPGGMTPEMDALLRFMSMGR